MSFNLRKTLLQLGKEPSVTLKVEDGFFTEGNAMYEFLVSTDLSLDELRRRVHQSTSKFAVVQLCQGKRTRNEAMEF